MKTPENNQILNVINVATLLVANKELDNGK